MIACWTSIIHDHFLTSQNRHCESEFVNHHLCTLIITGAIFYQVPGDYVIDQCVALLGRSKLHDLLPQITSVRLEGCCVDLVLVGLFTVFEQAETNRWYTDHMQHREPMPHYIAAVWRSRDSRNTEYWCFWIRIKDTILRRRRMEFS